MILYGLKNCDTTRKASHWLTEHDCDFQFVDVREDGVDGNTLRRWLTDVGWEALLNRRSTTWRQLSETQRRNLNADKALELITEYPTLIKRPVLQHDGGLLVGFDADAYAAALVT